MSQPLHAQANAVLYRALEHAPAERHRFIEQACAGCRELFQLVSSMLSHIDQLDAFIHEPLAASSEEAQAAARPGVGDSIGRWRVIRELERGRLGDILLVEERDAGTQQIAALKIVEAETLSLEQLALFHRQRQLLASLTHPDIARLLDSGALPDGDPYIVLEYSDGLPIDTFCSDTGASREARIALMARVCLAVHHGHQHLVLHRHLEPSTILVERDGALKLSDFGVSGLFEGVPSSATTADDIAALGVVLRKLLLDEGGRLPRALDSIIEKAASGDGYGSADQLARALLGYLEPDALPPPALLEPALAPSSKLPARAIGAALLVAIGAGAALALQPIYTDKRGGQVLAKADAAPARAAPARARAAGQTTALPPAQDHLARAHVLVASGSYAAADSEFAQARKLYSALPASSENKIALAEIDLARANAQYLRKHWRTAGQTVRALRAALPPEASDGLRARAALLEALIQPGGTAAQAYAGARKALPVLLAEAEAGPAETAPLREAALALRRTGEIAARAGHKAAACKYYALAEQRYATLDGSGYLNDEARAARSQLATLRADCA